MTIRRGNVGKGTEAKVSPFADIQNVLSHYPLKEVLTLSDSTSAKPRNDFFKEELCTVANKSTCYALVRDFFFLLVVYSTPTSEKASHSYSKTAQELIGGIHIKRRTAPPLVNSVTRQFSYVPQSVVTGGLVQDCTFFTTKVLIFFYHFHIP